MKLHRSVPFVLFGFTLAVAAWGPIGETEITAEEILKHVKYLASDKLEGRRAGTRGDKKAARYITREFRSYGLKPMGDSRRSFRHSFEFISGVKLGRRNRLEVKSVDGMQTLKLHKDFRPVGFSASGSAEGRLVFAGYGIDADDPDYHDYEGVDVDGKVVVILRHSPDGTNPHGEFSRFAALRYKAMTARENGASAVIFVTGPEDDPDENYLMKLRYDQSFADSGIPVVMVTQKRAKELISLARHDLSEVQKKMNEDQTPFSFDIPASVSVKVSVEKVSSRSVNLVGAVEGTDPDLSDQYVVVGAHYDHLGWGGGGSLAPDTVAIHNGADDNASGTSGLLELAQWFSEHPQKRSVVFAAFGAEELGLLGSAALADEPPFPLESVAAMVNMDMIGRLKDTTLVVGGAGTSSIWKEMVSEMAGQFDLSPKFDDAGYGSSDHQSFYLKDIPVLFLFTGTHENYHRPSDDWDLINADGEERVVRLAAEIIAELTSRSSRPDFIKVKQEQPTRGGFAVSLGTIPDYAGTEVKGMQLSGVREGSSADKGGLQAGDIIIMLGAKEVKSIYDYMYALQELELDKTVPIVVRRDGEEVKLEVTPVRRRE